MTNAADLNSLIGAELSAVAFVRSYVELHFDGPVLRSLAPPSVRKDAHVVRFGEPESRDALCGLIGQVVSAADDLAEALQIRFVDGEVVEIPKASPGVGAEVAHFVPTIDGRPDVASMRIWENLVPTRGG